MKKSVQWVLLLLGISVASFNQVTARPNEDPDYYTNDGDNENDDIDDDMGPKAKLITQPQTFSVHLGSTLKLPCKIENLAEAVVQWRRQSDPLFFDKTKQISDHRYSLDEKDMTLTVQNVQSVDQAVFQCIIIGESGQVVEHRVEVISEPKIKKTIPDSDVSYMKLGAPLTFMCEATGDPQPKVMWKTKLDTEEKLIESNSIAYDKLEGRHSGKYTCIAENNRGQRDERTVTLIVKAPPVVEVVASEVNSAEKFESELQCVVKNFYNGTAVKVTWSKNGNQIPMDRRHYEFLTEGTNKHILRISATKKEDFGNYTCVAKNDFGSSQGLIKLTGSPLKPEFLSTELTEQKNPLLKWTVVSKASVDGYEIYYRRQQDDEDIKVDLPAPSQNNSNTYILSHQFVDLHPGTYVAQVRAKNVYGYSQKSDQKFFPGGSGYLADSAMQSKYLEQVPGSSASNLRVSLVFVLSFLAAEFVR